jgi:hypothetical protein
VTDHNPKRIFQVAENFALALKVIDTYNNEAPASAPPGVGVQTPMLPRVVLAAFVLELYLKCIIAIERTQRKILRSHDHCELFNAISPNAQKAVKHEYQDLISSRNGYVQLMSAQFPGQNLDFDSVLDAGKSAFILFRYAYENDNCSLLKWPSDPIIAAVRSYLLANYSNEVQ